MTDSSAGGGESPGPDEGDAGDEDTPPERGASAGADGSGDTESGNDLAERVESEYDFEEFGPREMSEMTVEEWESAFDPETWITGPELLDRVEDDLRHRVATRDVFAVVERDSIDGDPVVLAYSDEGYAVVYEDGTVEGRGTVLRDVEPTVALCSMDDYEVSTPPEDAGLPDPQDVPEGSSGIGTTLLQYVGISQVVAGILLFLSPFVYDPLVRTCPGVAGSSARNCTVAGTTVQLHPLGDSAVIAAIAGVGFVLFGGLMLLVVANARLSDRFRSEEFRNRLRSAGLGDGERPEFVPETDSKQ